MAMTPFAWVMVGIFVVFIAAIVLLGVYSPRSGADVLDWRPRRAPENEDDEIAEMLAASNALRRRRGAPERTAEEVADSVEADRRELE
jgi:hypothetical protein